MAIKEITAFINHSTEDFGLSSTDTKAHVPQFFMLRKWPVDEPTGSSRHFHPCSAEASLTTAVEPKDEDMERWTSSSAEEGMDAEATPETDQPMLPWHLRDPTPTPSEEEARNAEETALAAEQQQQQQPQRNVGPVEQWMRHRPAAFQETRDASDSDPSTLELVDRSPGSSMSSGILEQYEAYQREHGKGKGQGTLSFTVTEVPRN